MLPCQNTTVTLVRHTGTVVDGRIGVGNADYLTGINAYREFTGSQIIDTEAGRVNQKTVLFIVDTEDVIPSDIIRDESNSVEYQITDLQTFEDHSEASCEEVIAGD
jgi:hypothetical protein